MQLAGRCVALALGVAGSFASCAAPPTCGTCREVLGHRFGFTPGLHSDVLAIEDDGTVTRWFEGRPSGHGPMVLRCAGDDRVRLVGLEARTPTEDYLVTGWGEDLLLVPVDSIDGFLRSVNLGGLPWAFSRGDPRSGLPRLSPAWQDHVLDHEVRTTTMLHDGELWVGAGSADGLRPGMALLLLDRPSPFGVVAEGGPATRDVPLRVTSVEEHRSRVETWWGSPDEWASGIPVGLAVRAGPQTAEP